MRDKLLLGLALMVAGPALADVKAGVDAWAKGDFKRAVAQWRGPATAGDADAQFNLGQAYKLGRGVTADPALAEDWFHRAALQGQPQAGDNYALALFQSGRKSEALPWLEKSVARGEPRCQLVLGTILFNGDGVPRDYPRAYALMTRAAAAGLPSAAETLARMDQYITAADRERGIRLAQRYAADAAIRAAAAPGLRVAEPPPNPAKPVTAPRPAVAGQVPPATDLGQGVPVATRSGAGGWSAQLGAFRSRANADALWEELKGKFPGAQPLYHEAGGLIRVQAGGYATKAAARAACAKAGMNCIILAP